MNLTGLQTLEIIKKAQVTNLRQLGTSSISLTLNSNLPKSQILRELDDNIHKYAKEEISDTDIIRVATRITNKQLQDIEKLNELAEIDKEQFVKRLEEEATKQKELEESRIKRLEDAFQEFAIKSEELDKTKKDFEIRSTKIEEVMFEKTAAESKVADLEEQLRIEKLKNKEIKLEEWTKNQISSWKRRSWVEFIISICVFIIILVYIMYSSNWDLNNAQSHLKKWQSNIIISGGLWILTFFFTAITVKTLVAKYRNHSNIQNYIKGLKVPDDLK